MKNFDEMINKLVEVEMSEYSHDDSPEDYGNKLDFYLSNVEKDSYLNYIKDYHIPEATDEELINLQESVVAEIKRRYEAIRLAASMAGKKGGKSKSAAKAEASRENGKKGGRPKMKT